MCKFLISIFIFCLSCFGIVGNKKVSAHDIKQDDQKKDIPVTDDPVKGQVSRAPYISEVIKTDPVTGDLQPAPDCYECENYLHCLGYVSEKLHRQKGGLIDWKPCDVTPVEVLPYMGLQVIEDMCADCEYPFECNRCPLRGGRSGFIQDCDSCYAREICEGVQAFHDFEQPEPTCVMFKNNSTEH